MIRLQSVDVAVENGGPITEREAKRVIEAARKLILQHPDRVIWRFKVKWLWFTASYAVRLRHIDGALLWFLDQVGGPFNSAEVPSSEELPE